ncbi:MAG TPA: endonuclease/exonuclease/phosphatase family protein [Thermomicrobiales bacterium]|nr:endonuclease/exonuclease/phosphatase family protein [Thermomicrobiales bacterium]
MEDRLRVATLNIYGRQGNWPERRNVLQQGFHDLRPDLMAFQEVVKTDDWDQIADFLGDDYHVVHQTIGKTDELGVAIASRWPIMSVQELDLNVTPRTADFPCTTLVARIEVPGRIGELLFVNHFPNWQLDFEHERELQAVIAARFIENELAESPMHVIIAGDLDADPNAASIRFFTGHQSLGGMSVCYRDAWTSHHQGEPGATFTTDNALMANANWDWPFGRIDHILVRCGLHGGPTLMIEACERIFDQPVDGIWGSDHFGVMADLTVPPA